MFIFTINGDEKDFIAFYPFPCTNVNNDFYENTIKTFQAITSRVKWNPISSEKKIEKFSSKHSCIDEADVLVPKSVYTRNMENWII